SAAVAEPSPEADPLHGDREPAAAPAAEPTGPAETSGQVPSVGRSGPSPHASGPDHMLAPGAKHRDASVRPAGPEQPAAADLAAEVAALDEARSALNSGDADKALASLEAHRTTFSHGSLGPEAMVVRIEALLSQGKRAEARALAQGFLAQHPDSPSQERVRA